MIVEATIAFISVLAGGIGGYYIFGGKNKNAAAEIDHSVVNNAGVVNNVLINNDTVSVEYMELMVAIYIICAIKSFEFIFLQFGNEKIGEEIRKQTRQRERT